MRKLRATVVCVRILPLMVVVIVLSASSTTAFSPAAPPISSRTRDVQQNYKVTWCAKKKASEGDDSESSEQPQNEICETIKFAFASLHEAIQRTFKSLTELSLKDYKWRSSVFKSNEADRLLEQSLARMRGEDASYVRPMDATDEKLGPLVCILRYGTVNVKQR